MRSKKRLNPRSHLLHQHLRSQQSYHALVVRSHFFGVVCVKHAPGFVFLLTGVAETAALAAVCRAGPKRRPVPLQHTQQRSKTNAAHSQQTASSNRCAALHKRNPRRRQPARRWSECPPTGHEAPPWLGSFPPVLCPDSVAATSLNCWPHLPRRLKTDSLFLPIKNDSERIRRQT